MKIAIMGDIHPDGIDILNSNYFKAFKVQNLDEQSLINDLKDVDGIVIRTAKLTDNILSHCKKLKIVSRHGVGYDNVDSNYLLKNNIALAITGTSNAVSVAEHVMTMFLYLTKNIQKSDSLVRNGNFKKKSELPDFFELYKKKVLILGFGRIGQQLAKRCLGFDMEVYVYDPYVNIEFIKKNYCKVISKDEGFKIADYISVHLPLNEKTKNFIDSNEFSLFKNNLVIVNTARGGIINEDSLIDALKNKRIRGAGLDVFTKEPPIENNEFFNLDNIILSPHNAALTLECRKRMSVEACQNICFFLNNSPKLNLKNIIK